MCRAIARHTYEPSSVDFDGCVHRALSALLAELLARCCVYTLQIHAPLLCIPLAEAPPGAEHTFAGTRPPGAVLRIHVADTRPSVADTRCGYPPKCRGYTLRIPAQVSRIHVADTRPSVADTRAASREVVGFGVEPRWLVAGCELGCGEAIALGVEQAHGVL